MEQTIITNSKPGEAGETALRRWKQGHQIFDIVLDGMLHVIEQSRNSLDKGDPNELVTQLSELAILFDAATAAFRYATAFPPEMYIEYIRPTMTPPALRAGFSGTLNRKHNEMKAKLGDLQRELRAAFAGGGNLPNAVRAAWEKLIRAKRANRENHALVCERFVPGGQSLLSAYYQAQRKLNQGRQIEGKGEEVVYIVERFILKAERASEATEIMQRLDDLLGPAAHEHSGWCGHALFLQDVTRPHEILMFYPWRNIDLHADLRTQEEPRLTSFYAQYCQAPREITVFQPLDVEVDHVHEHDEPMARAEEAI